MSLNLTVPFSSAVFGLGVLHAFDVDHIMAISGLAGSRPDPKKMFSLCARWALGHGLILLIVGVAVLALGMSLPNGMGEMAEIAVGLILIGIGLWTFWDLSKNKLEDVASNSFKNHVSVHQHSSVIVGMFHGLAGSAVLLALIPITNQDSAWSGLAYLTVFSLGVLTSMTAFGGLYGIFFSQLNQKAFRMATAFRVLIAFSNLLLGIYWIHDSV
jgi:sulfite exporter TauE/SafE